MKRNILFSCFLVIALASCRYDKAEMEPVCTPPDVVSFSQDIQPIFNANCNTSGCHSGSYPAGGLNLEASVSYAQLMNAGSGYIDTLQPAFSLLYAQMRSSSNPMPPTGKLDNCKISLVLKWIQQNANNN